LNAASIHLILEGCEFAMELLDEASVCKVIALLCVFKFSQGCGPGQMKTRGIKLSVLLILGLALVGQADDAFHVVGVFPGNKTQGVELEPLIQIHVSEKFDPASVTEDGVKLFRLSDKNTVAINVGGELGGVIHVSVNQRLQLNTEYELSVTAKVKSRKGDSLKPLSARFRTADKQPPPPRDDISSFRFEKTRIDHRDGICGLAIAGGRLFACTWDGKLFSYTLDQSGELVGEPKLEFQVKRRINAIVADPTSTHEKIILWLSYDSQQGLSLGPNDFSGVLFKVKIDRGVLSMHAFISGLPTGDHPASGCLLYTSPSPRDRTRSRMPSSA